MKKKQTANRNEKIKTAIEKENGRQELLHTKLVEGADKRFVADVEAFIKKNESALKRLAKK